MMTGNTVFLGLALGQGDGPAALRSLIALVGFGVGAILGAVIVEADPSTAAWPGAVTRALALEAMVFAAFIAAWHLSGTPRGAPVVAGLIVALALAMGIQSAAVRRLGVPGIATTYITGTLTALMVDLIGPLSARVRRARVADESPLASWERKVGLLSAVLAVYALGALVGGLLHARASPLLTLLPLVSVALVVAHARLGGRRPPSA